MSEKKFFENKEYNKVLFESANFIAIPSLGSLIEGWLLIVPKKHYLSMGYICKDSILNELHKFVEKVGDIVQNTYGQYVVFENGAFCNNDKVGCGVDYAHIHIVPTDLDIIKEAEKATGIYFDWVEVNTTLTPQSYVLNSKPYLYVKNQKGIEYITTSDLIPSQYFRKGIANSLGDFDKFDWKSYSLTDIIDSTIQSYNKITL